MTQPTRLPCWPLRVGIIILFTSLAVSLSWDLASALSYTKPHRAKHRVSSPATKRRPAGKLAKRVRHKRVQGVDGRLIAIIWAPRSAASAALDRDSVAGVVPLTQEDRVRLEQSLDDDLSPTETPGPAAVVPEPPLIWPTAGPMGSPFGPRRGGFHAGIDIKAPRFQPVVAAADGRVLYARASRGKMGNVVVLEHADGMMTVYAHLARIGVKEETIVEQGESIATVGSTGRTTGPHLHFAVRVDGTTVNPESFLPVSKGPALLHASSPQ